MDRRAAKEPVHIRGWLERVDDITQRGKQAYLADALLGGRRLADDETGGGRQPVVPARRARARRSRVGPRACEPQLHHPPVRPRSTANRPGSRSRAISRHGGHPWRHGSWKPRPRSKTTPAETPAGRLAHADTRRNDAPDHGSRRLVSRLLQGNLFAAATAPARTLRSTRCRGAATQDPRDWRAVA
jgi:hypothetical protein